LARRRLRVRGAGEKRREGDEGSTRCEIGRHSGPRGAEIA